MKAKFFNDLIQMERTSSVHNEFGFSIAINPKSPIFEGHFPNMPILPGVVMMEIIKRATALVLEKKLFLNHSRSVKFLKLIEPNLVNRFDLHLKVEPIENEFSVRAVLSYDMVIYYKQIVNFKVK